MLQRAASLPRWIPAAQQLPLDVLVPRFCRPPPGTHHIRRHASSSSKSHPRSPTVRKLEREKTERQRTAALREGQGPEAARPDSTDHLAFADRDVLAAFERNVPLFQAEFSPSECVEATKTYVAVLNENKGTSGKTLERVHGISPYKLHLLGIMLLSGDSSDIDHWKLGTQMLVTASESAPGFMPSTMTILRLFGGLRGRDGRATAPSRLLRDAEARFSSYFQQSRRGKGDPHALTLAGLMARARGDDGQALKWLLEAAKVGSASAQSNDAGGAGANERKALADTVKGAGGSRLREARWSWEPSCLLAMGRIYLKSGRREKAKEMLTAAALELDNAEAYMALAGLVPPDAPERALYLTKAAISGVPGAAQQLSEVESNAASLEHDRETARQHSMMAKEWRGIASADAAEASPGA